MSRAPKRQMKRRQRRRRKIRHLRRQLAQKSDFMERQRLIAKIQKISPKVPVPEK